MAKPNTYSQISMHFVFAVKHRKALILPEFKDRLMYYIHRIIVNKDQKPLAINGTCDHIHLFIGLSPTIYIPDLIRDIKSDSSQFINHNKLSTERFQWQEGYGAFSYGKSQRDRVIKYILNQEEHHKRQNFREEYKELLEKMEVEFDQKYLFGFFK